LIKQYERKTKNLLNRKKQRGAEIIAGFNRWMDQMLDCSITAQQKSYILGNCDFCRITREQPDKQ